jgi:hypothetical protein
MGVLTFTLLHTPKSQHGKALSTHADSCSRPYEAGLLNRKMHVLVYCANCRNIKDTGADINEAPS